MNNEQAIAIWVNQILTKFEQANPQNVQYVDCVVEFLVDNYELLHYYDYDYVVNDVNKYLKEQKHV